MTVLHAMLLAMSLPARGEDKPSATPPRWMPALTAEAIQRLSPKIDTVLVTQGARPAVPESPTDRTGELVLPFFGQARVVDSALYYETLRQLSLASSSRFEVLKPYRIVCSIEATSEFKPPRHTRHSAGLCRFDAVSIYFFEQGEIDPARVLWEAFRAQPTTEHLQVGDVEVLLRKGLENFYCWSPRPFVAVIVRRDRLLEETVQRWKAAEAGAGPFPWSLPEWTSISEGATAWGLRRLPEAGPGAFHGVVLSVDPRLDPNAVTVTWHGSSKIRAPGLPEFPDAWILRHAASRELKLIEEPDPKISVRVSSSLIGAIDTMTPAVTSFHPGCEYEYWQWARRPTEPPLFPREPIR